MNQKGRGPMFDTNGRSGTQGDSKNHAPKGSKEKKKKKKKKPNKKKRIKKKTTPHNESQANKKNSPSSSLELSCFLSSLVCREILRLLGDLLTSFRWKTASFLKFISPDNPSSYWG